jgi:glycogen debranching enzyme
MKPATSETLSKALAFDEPVLSALHIPATTSLPERRPRALKDGDLFAVFDHRGDIGGEPGSPEGLYHADTRILSEFQLLIDGCRPLLLSSTIQDNNAVFVADLTNPDLISGGALLMRRELIYISRMKFLWNGACHERLLVRNFDDKPRQLTLGLRFAADFADLFEVRGLRRLRRGQIAAEPKPDNAMVLRYRGLDEVERVLALAFDPQPDHVDSSTALFDLELKPGEGRRLFLRLGTVEPTGEDCGARSFYRGMRAARRKLRATAARASAVESSNSLFNEILRRSRSDLAMLMTDTEQGPYPYAGIPWYSAPFGRDGLITALFTLWLDPAIAKGVLKFHAAHQARETDPRRDAQPGKILHELRHGEMARLGEVPFDRHYGSVDATPLFVLLLGEYYARTGDLETVRALWPHVEAALAWIDRYGDIDGDGFVEYGDRDSEIVVNQGWKDSPAAIFHEDGRAPAGPVALCEIQGYVYGAKRAAAAMADALGLGRQAVALRQQAQTLRRRFEAAFWCDDISTYALALDGDKRPCRVVASNAGHVLLSGIASRERARRVADTLMGAACFSGWGVRTLAVSAKRYNPMSYHNGSIWPHDNALLALGLARYGFKDAVLRIFEGLYDAAACMDLRRLPELFCGFPRRQRSGPTLYPVACAPQAWASAATLAMLQASLGARWHPGSAELRFDRPTLPDFIDELRLGRLGLGGASVDVLLRRHGGAVAVTVERRRGDLKVVVQQ